MNRFFGELEEHPRLKSFRSFETAGSTLLAEIHHVSKFHDPSSAFYLGQHCENCPWSELEGRLREQYQRERAMQEARERQEQADRAARIAAYHAESRRLSWWGRLWQWIS